MTVSHVRERLRAGRPLVVAADSSSSLRARGVALDVPGALGLLLRERPADVLEHHRVEVGCRADVLVALTGDTMPRSLAEVGMEHRSAQLTSRAVELALEAAEASPKPVAVAGVLGSEIVSPVAEVRLQEELEEHSARLAAAGCELLIARGQGSRLNLMAAVVAAARAELPVWAVIERGVDTAGDPGLFQALHDAGASVALFEVPSVALGVSELQRASAFAQQAELAVGVLLAASQAALPGFPDESASPEQWASHALDLDVAGARVIGGGAGTTEEHLDALARALGALHPSLPARPPEAAPESSPSRG